MIPPSTQSCEPKSAPTNALHRFPIGTQYIARGKRQDVCTVEDHLTTTNSNGEVVSVRYVTSHLFCGKAVTESDVVDTTIARGLLPAFVHLLEPSSAACESAPLAYSNFPDDRSAAQLEAVELKRPSRRGP